MASNANLDLSLGKGDEYELGQVSELLFNTGDSKERAIVNWRVGCFFALGIEPSTAAALARRRDVDREQVERMVAQGATSAHLSAILL